MRPFRGRKALLRLKALLGFVKGREAKDGAAKLLLRTGAIKAKPLKKRESGKKLEKKIILGFERNK